MLSLSHIWLTEPLPVGFCVLLMCLSDSLSTFFLSSKHTYSMYKLPFLCPSARMNHFFKELWFLLVRHFLFRIQDLGAIYAYCYWG